MSRFIRVSPVLTVIFAFILVLSLPVTASAQGLALYSQKCVMCHGAEGAGGFAHRSIRGASSSRILKGINMRPDMAFLSYLSTAEINSPDLAPSEAEVWDVTSFIVQQLTPMTETPPVALTPAAFEASKNVYFDRCAGCHGLYRTGVTTSTRPAPGWVGPEDRPHPPGVALRFKIQGVMP